VKVFRITVSTGAGQGQIYTLRAKSIANVARYIRHWHTARIETIPSRGTQS
jgi:hypothetical protein